MASRTRSSNRARRCGLAAAGTGAVLVAAIAVGLAAATVEPPFTACLVTGDGSPSLSNTPIAKLALAGVQAAEARGVRARVVHSSGPSNDVASLRDCVLGGADVTIGAGSLMAGPINDVASEFPKRKFVIVDVNVTALASRPANVQGLLFKAQQAGYLVGYAAGLWAKARGAAAVGSVGGLKIPPVDSYIAGFQAGAKRANPGIKTLNTYAQSFTDQSKCTRAALSQIAHGSVVELQVAGHCGLGVLRAARAKHVFAIGVDTGQGTQRPWVMTSALKRVDVGVLSAILAARDGTLEDGRQRCLRRRARRRRLWRLEPAGTRRHPRRRRAPVSTAAGRRDPRHPRHGRLDGSLDPRRSHVVARRHVHGRGLWREEARRPDGYHSTGATAGTSRRCRRTAQRLRAARGRDTGHAVGGAASAAGADRRGELPATRAISSVAAANPDNHFALVGASVGDVKQPNLAGIVFRESQAAQLGGVLAGYTAAAAQGVAAPPVAWVGPADPGLVRSFRLGVHQVAGGVNVLVDRSPLTPAACKESALSAFLRGAVAAMARRGLCAAAVASAAAERNRVAESLGDFELPDAAVAAVVRSAVNGSYVGGEDVIFGFATGAIGVRRLDPRVPADVAVRVRDAAQALSSGRRPAID